MVIRSVAAAPRHGLVLPKKGCARIGPLVHKASAGTLLKATIFHTQTLGAAVPVLKDLGYELIGLAGEAFDNLADIPMKGSLCFLLGNESLGLSHATQSYCDRMVRIPMGGGINSLNVAAAATLVSFRGIFQGGSDTIGGISGAPP